MCWSFKVSLYTFIAATIASYYLWFRNRKNDRIFSVYIFAIGLIQGIEALAWHSVNTNDSSAKLNKIVGGLLKIGILLQFVIIYCYMYYSTKIKLYLYLSVIFLLLIIISNKNYKVTLSCNYNKSLLTTNELERKCAIEWNWLGDQPLSPGVIFYILGLLLPLLTVKDKRTKYIIIIPLLTYIFSIYKYNQTKLWAGYWCLTSNAWIPFALI